MKVIMGLVTNGNKSGGGSRSNESGTSGGNGSAVVPQLKRVGSFVDLPTAVRYLVEESEGAELWADLLQPAQHTGAPSAKPEAALAPEQVQPGQVEDAHFLDRISLALGRRRMVKFEIRHPKGTKRVAVYQIWEEE